MCDQGRGFGHERASSGAGDRRLRDLRSTAVVASGRRTGHDGAVVLAYHDVCPDAHGYHVTPRRLRAQLALVRSSGLELVALTEIVARIERGAPVDGLAAVTFDDALAGVAEHGLGVLDELRVPATVFAVTHDMGERPAWWPGASRTLSGTELRVLDESPLVSVASHTRTHRSLPELDDEELADELAGSRRRLEDVLGRPVDLLAYPSGHHDARVRSATQAGGYRAAFTFRNGRVTPDLDRYRIPRFTMGSHHHRLRLAVHLGRATASWPDTQLDALHGTGSEPAWI